MKNFRQFGVLGALALASALMVSGCGKKDESGGEGGDKSGEANTEEGSASASDCEKMVDKMVECIDDIGESDKEKLVKRCSDKSSAAELALMLPCASKSSCDDFKSCMDEGSKKARKLSKDRRIKKRIGELKKHIEDKNWKEAGSTCRIFSDSENPEFNKLCEQAQEGITGSLFTELQKQRDEFKVADDSFSQCYDLKRSAKGMSDDKAKEAEALCAEVDAAKKVARAREAIKETIKESKGRVPYECGSAVKDLEKIESEWSKKTLETVKKECEQDLPKKLVSAQVDALVKMRDSGDTKDGFSKCFDLKRLTKSLSEEEQNKAKALCDEVDAADDVKQALDEAKKAVTNKDSKVPFKCGWALDKLEKLEGSDWAKTEAKKVAKACYVDAGKFVLEAKVPSMRICDFNVKKVFQGVKKYELKDPSIDDLIAKAAKKCN